MPSGSGAARAGAVNANAQEAAPSQRSAHRMWRRTAMDPLGLPEQLFDLAGEPLVDRLAAQLEGGRQLPRLDAELHREQPELLDRLVGGEAAVHLVDRSEEHTSELQSQFHLVCR